MNYILDTNICIYIIKQKPKIVLDRFKEHKPGDIGISSITLAELQFGVNKSVNHATILNSYVKLYLINNNTFVL